MIDLTDEQHAVISKSIATYRGQGTQLETALGALVMGQHYGWRVLKLIHSPSTYKKYEKILGVSFQDVCPERTPLSKKCNGLRIADALNSFWAVVMGKTQVKDKGMLSEPEQEDQR